MLKSASYSFSFICSSSSDLHSEPARIKVHETNITGTQNNGDLSHFYRCCFLDWSRGGTFASFFVSHHGAFDRHFWTHYRQFTTAFHKNANVRRSAWKAGAMCTAGIDWCITGECEVASLGKGWEPYNYKAAWRELTCKKSLTRFDLYHQLPCLSLCLLYTAAFQVSLPAGFEQLSS